jgi:precorrin-2 dehydrogenase/sirohydrochlorin ferrochelatase
VSKAHPYYPIFLDLEGRRVIIVGGGGVSARKVESMLRHGASVTVIAPECTADIEQAAAEGRLTLVRRNYEATDVAGAALVIASTNSAAINERIAHDCRERNILVNVVDDTSLCDFIVPAIVENGSIQIAVSTGGKSPAFARLVKHDLQDAIGPEYAEVNDILGSLREAAKASPKLATDPDRKRFFDALLALDVLTLLRDGRRLEAYRAIADLCGANGVVLSDLVRSGLRA